MGLDTQSLSGFEVLPVRLDGRWADASRRDWIGAAVADVPLVGMSFLQSSGICEWCKSERDEPSPEVRLALFPFDSEGLDVQVNFSVGHGGRRRRTLVPSAVYRPRVSNSQLLETGSVYRLATVDGDPAVNLFCLFLVRSDVESSRGTLWRVRKQLESGLEEPFRQWLTHGRTGSCEG